ncbi:hypothetical protein M2132_001644 [Dysgonomonas sp. PH5-45]|uniref:T9SS type A sorting domain-containing protein n=1 Tax=unclassified Dysgonomonas TaxID=2630389 RepID=UPI00247389FE|nr:MULTISPECIES: T9SS type A sorting domain-containing protein [unclassified Dysgonomonas]MDH6355305.1 hypothetical protein [Dysgonomonas sp. PH5-45]MDH6388169.1 hypothetical protein [Dysgonomonas sp. PH5-37]
MKRNKLFLSLCVLFSALSWVSVSAQISEGGTPPSFNFENTLKFAQQPYVVNFTGDIQKLKLEDEILVQNGGPQRTGMPISVDININKTGKWTTLSDGQEIWQQTLKSPGATALFIVYDDLYIPEGGKLYLYTADRKQVIGAFTHKNTPNGGRVFSTEPLFQDEVVFEYVKSKVSDEAPRLSVSRVAYMYNVVSPYATADEVDLSCMVNVNCPEGDNWQKQKRGVLQLTYMNKGGESFICSGSLINNLKQDGTPYVLSADHCFSNLQTHEVLTDFSTMVARFNYEYRDCGSNIPGRASSLTGASPLVQIPIKGNSDGFLFVMDDDVPASYKAYYNGWNVTSQPPQSGVVIHHPAGYDKKISTFLRPAANAGVSQMVDNVETGENSHWALKYSETESGFSAISGGSSGSPLFNQDGLIVGTLTGGYSSCAYPRGKDIYGKLWYHWDQYGTEPAGHIKSYLDPDNTGATALLGYDPATDEPGNPLSIGDVENANNKALLFPSPFTDNLNINAGDILRTVKVFDLSGRTVYEANNLSSSTLTIPASAWTKGSYIIVLETEKGKETHKVIK